MKISRGIPVLDEKDQIERLAAAFLNKLQISKKAELDAFHIACASVHEIDYLLTWNCRHIANASLRRMIESVNEKHGYKTPVICTPEELLEVI